VERDDFSGPIRPIPGRRTRILRRIGSTRLGQSLGIVVMIHVPGRHTGEVRSVHLVPIKQDGNWYVCGFGGEADWVRNVRTAGKAEFTRQGRTISVDVVEVEGDERQRAQDALVRLMIGSTRREFYRLPDASDHPTFRLETIE